MGARRDHHAFEEHAVVEPAALAHDAVDREHEADRRTEELVVAPMLGVHPRLVGPGDAEQRVEVPADLAAPLDVGRDPLGRVVRVFLAVPCPLLGVVVRGDETARQRLQRPAGEDVDLPRLRVRPGRRARGGGEDSLDGRARNRRRQKGPDRTARGDRGLGRGEFGVVRDRHRPGLSARTGAAAPARGGGRRRPSGDCSRGSPLTLLQCTKNALQCSARLYTSFMLQCSIYRPQDHCPSPPGDPYDDR